MALDDVRVVIYEPDGTRRGPVLAPLELKYQHQEGQAFTIDLTLSRHAPTHDIVYAPCVAALEYLSEDMKTWVEPMNARCYLHNDQDEPHDTTGRRVVTLAGFEGQLGFAIVGTKDLSPSLKREFYDLPAGAILHTLLTDAKARGTLTRVSFDFTATTDSMGRVWPTSTVTTALYAPSVTLKTVLGDFVTSGLLDAWWEGQKLRVVARGQGPQLKQDGDVPLVRRAGLTGAHEAEQWSDMATRVLLLGKGDYRVTKEATNPSTPYGVIEATISAGEVNRPAMADQLLTARLDRSKNGPAHTYTYDWTLGGDRSVRMPLPLRDFVVGQLVDADTSEKRERLKVGQLSITRDNDGLVQCTVSLGKLITDPVVASVLKQRAQSEDAELAGVGAFDRNRGAVAGTGGGGTDPTPPVEVTPETHPAVRHNNDAKTARPAGAVAVYWYGSVRPENMQPGDFWRPMTGAFA